MKVTFLEPNGKEKGIAKIQTQISQIAKHCTLLSSSWINAAESSEHLWDRFFQRAVLFLFLLLDLRSALAK